MLQFMNPKTKINGVKKSSVLVVPLYKEVELSSILALIRGYSFNCGIVSHDD